MSSKTIQNFKIMKISLLKIIFTLAFFLSPFVAFAGSQHNMSGYAWSENIGWISFNCTNESNQNACATSDYGVNKNVNGTLTGRAWSENIGWIQFGNLTGVPMVLRSDGGGTVAQDARLDVNNLTGWARACAGMNDLTAPPENQSAPNNTCAGRSRTDGWDGWISLSGSNYGVTKSGNNLTGYAWGSDVVGWINFNATTSGGVVIGGNTMSYTLNAPNSCIIPAGDSKCAVTLSWSVTNPELVGGSTVTSNTNNLGVVSVNQPIGTGDLGNISVDIPYIMVGGILQGSQGRTFTLKNNSKNLTSTTVTPSCAPNAGWNNTINKCVTGLVNGYYSGWGACSVTGACGQTGFQTGICIPPQNGGSACPLTPPTQPCSTQSCTSATPVCGNGIFEPPSEQCDAGTGSASCTTQCKKKPIIIEG